MISNTNHDSQWGRSEVVIIYPEVMGTTPITPMKLYSYGYESSTGTSPPMARIHSNPLVYQQLANIGIIGPYTYLVGGAITILKHMTVNGVGIIPYMTWKIKVRFQTTNQIPIIHSLSLQMSPVLGGHIFAVTEVYTSAKKHPSKKIDK